MIGLWFMNSLLIIVPEGAPLALNLIHIRAESWQLGCRPCRWGNGLGPALRSSLLPSDVTYYLDVKTSRQCGRRATRCVAYIEVWVKSWVHEIKKWSFKWANSWPLEMLTPTSLPRWCQRKSAGKCAMWVMTVMGLWAQTPELIRSAWSPQICSEISSIYGSKEDIPRWRG